MRRLPVPALWLGVVLAWAVSGIGVPLVAAYAYFRLDKALAARTRPVEGWAARERYIADVKGE